MDASVFDDDARGDADLDLAAAYEALPNEVKALVS